MFDFHDYVCLAASGGKECMVKMNKLLKIILGICCVFILVGCQSEKENGEVNNTLSQEQEENNNTSTPISSNSEYIEGWSEEKRKLDGCSYTFLIPINASGYQYFRRCNMFSFSAKKSEKEVKVLFDSLTNLDGKNVSLIDINEQTKVLRNANLYHLYENDGNVQYNEQFENVNVAGYETLLDKGTAKDNSGDLFNYAIYQLYLGEEKDGVCELLVGSEEMDSDSLAEIGEELIATIQPEE